MTHMMGGSQHSFKSQLPCNQRSGTTDSFDGEYPVGLHDDRKVSLMKKQKGKGKRRARGGKERATATREEEEEKDSAEGGTSDDGANAPININHKGHRTRNMGRDYNRIEKESAKGSLYVERDAASILKVAKRNILAAGIYKVEGTFSRSDVIFIKDENDMIFAKGIVNFSRDDLDKIKKLHTDDIPRALGRRDEEMSFTKRSVIFSWQYKIIAYENGGLSFDGLGTGSSPPPTIMSDGSYGALPPLSLAGIPLEAGEATDVNSNHATINRQGRGRANITSNSSTSSSGGGGSGGGSATAGNDKLVITSTTTTDNVVYKNSVYKVGSVVHVLSRSSTSARHVEIGTIIPEDVEKAQYWKDFRELIEANVDEVPPSYDFELLANGEFSALSKKQEKREWPRGSDVYLLEKPLPSESSSTPPLQLSRSSSADSLFSITNMLLSPGPASQSNLLTMSVSSSSLASSGINDSDYIRRAVSASLLEQEVHVFILCLDGHKLRFGNLNMHVTKIRDMKSKILQKGEETKFKYNYADLTFNGIPLDDEHTFSDLGIHSGATLEMEPITYNIAMLVCEFLFSRRDRQNHTLDANDAPLNFEREREVIANAITHKNQRKDIGLDFEYATRQSFANAFSKKVNVLHYSGHGGLVNDRGMDHAFVTVETGDGMFEAIFDRELPKFLQLAKENDTLPDLVVLASCYTSRLGAEFIKAGVKHVLCLDVGGKDGVVIRFMENFYINLCKGFKVLQCFEMANNMMERRSVHDANAIVLLPRFEGEDGEEKFKAAHDRRIFPSPGVEYSVETITKIKKRLTDCSNVFQPTVPLISGYKVIGRCVASHTLLTKLRDSTVRCLNITGPKEIGKSYVTKMVVSYVQRRDFFADGVVYFKLGSNPTRDMLVKCLEDNLRYNIANTGSSSVVNGAAVSGGKVYDDREIDDLFRYLRDSDSLIFIDDACAMDSSFKDNYDVIELYNFLSRLLETCRKIKVIITSCAGVPEISSSMFSLNLEPLDDAAAVELMISTSKATSTVRNLLLECLRSKSMNKLVPRNEEEIRLIEELSNAKRFDARKYRRETVKYLSDHDFIKLSHGFPKKIIAMTMYMLKANLGLDEMVEREKRKLVAVAPS